MDFMLKTLLFYKLSYFTKWYINNECAYKFLTASLLTASIMFVFVKITNASFTPMGVYRRLFICSLQN